MDQSAFGVFPVVQHIRKNRTLLTYFGLQPCLGGAQGLGLAPCSGITSGGIWGNHLGC